ncbi:NADH-quinone oxidoreductase subunit E [Peptoclostridium litorale DSM 5388]|uniref:NADH dehydrogenase n=1 Tax=Peptoclostridium litorale DSM 5388 TaxID=1121324 RepID=A0A069RD01_PEPLI|nr:NAD(P)H-dependent oxidoreductase subunit E [Peptoclostridium litorale]KDR94949.1 NADH dehydrogenase [Peptoclostridium litorale DSM 5388]SIO33919.1 NADH-quinone oxidoreductase subunit E [Peptoclostridium litorale DSM 5388]
MDTTYTSNKTAINGELLGKIQGIVEKHGNSRDNLLAVLLDVQALSERHYLSREAIVGVSEVMDIRVQNVYEVASFYHALSTSPKGKYVIQLCQGTSCTVNGQKSVKSVLEAELGVKMGGTTGDDMFTIEYTPCFGACDIAPAMRLNGKVYGNLTELSVLEILDECRRG